LSKKMREVGLDDLLLERVLIAAEVEVTHQLHRDRRAALQRLAVGDVLHGGTEDPGQIDAIVVVEALILDRDRRIGEIPGDLTPRDRAAQLVGLDVAQARAVGGEHLRGAAGDQRMQRTERRRGSRDRQDIAGGGDRARETERRNHAKRDEQKAGGAGTSVPAPT